MAERIAAFLLWALVAASVVYWGLRVLVAPAPVPPQAATVSAAGAARGDVVRLFAAAQSAPTAGPAADPGLASRFKLVGVMAPRVGEAASQQGIALIAVDGKPPRPYRVGARLDRDLVLQSVAPRGAALGPLEGAPAVQLDLPPPQPAATGTLPPLPANVDPGLLPRDPSAVERAPAAPAVPSVVPQPAPTASPSGPRVVPDAPPPEDATQSGSAPQVPDNRR